VTRLLDMGLDRSTCVRAQPDSGAEGLLRRICGNCKEKVELTPEEYEAAKCTPKTKLKRTQVKQGSWTAKERLDAGPSYLET